MTPAQHEVLRDYVAEVDDTLAVALAALLSDYEVVVKDRNRWRYMAQKNRTYIPWMLTDLERMWVGESGGHP
jgi:hypothetical protein